MNLYDTFDHSFQNIRYLVLQCVKYKLKGSILCPTVMTVCFLISNNKIFHLLVTHFRLLSNSYNFIDNVDGGGMRGVAWHLT